MIFTFTNKQELFNCIKDLNQKYYKPADEFFKVFEEYSRQSAIFLLEFFRDAHGCLVEATMVKDVVSRKDVINNHLEKYVKILRIILIGDYAALIHIKITDLGEAPLLPKAKESMKEELNPIWEEFKKRTPLKIKNKTILLIKYTHNNTIEELDKELDYFKETYESVEKIYKKYRM